MADDNVNTQDAGVSNGDNKTDENLESIDRAELERLRERDKTLTKLDGWATEADIDGGAVSYVEALEQIANQPYNAPAEPASEPPKSGSGDKPTEPAPTGLSEADRAALEAAKATSEAASKASTIAFLSAQQSEWRREQDSLPEEDRSPMTAEELGKLVQRQPALFKSLSQDREHGGNIFKAANAYALSTSEGMRKVKEHAAAVQKAKDDAASAANLNTGGPTATPATTTEEEKLLAAMKAEADRIAPDDPPYEPPN